VADIFLSYAREDKPRVGQIATALESRGWTVWWDRRIPPGQVFTSYIQQQLDDARCIVVLWSKASIGSQFVIEEAREGIPGRLVPALIEAIRPPLGFRDFQTANLREWQIEHAHEEFERLLDAIGAIVRPGQTPPVSNQAANQAEVSRLPNPAAPGAIPKPWTVDGTKSLDQLPVTDWPRQLDCRWFVFHEQFGLRVLNTGTEAFLAITVTVKGIRRWSNRPQKFVESPETAIGGGLSGMLLTPQPIDLLPDQPQLIKFAEYTSSGIDIHLPEFRRISIVRHDCVWQLRLQFSTSRERWLGAMCFRWAPGPIHPCGCEAPFETGDQFGGYNQFNSLGEFAPK
jgi:TIR domain